MLNHPSLNAVTATRTHTNLGKPLYNSYCFSQLPSTILDRLTNSQTSTLPSDALPDTNAEKIIFLLIDGFGWRFIERFGSDLPCWRSPPSQQSVQSMLTLCSFPSGLSSGKAPR